MSVLVRWSRSRRPELTVADVFAVMVLVVVTVQVLAAAAAASTSASRFLRPGFVPHPG